MSGCAWDCTGCVGPVGELTSSPIAAFIFANTSSPSPPSSSVHSDVSWFSQRPPVRRVRMVSGAAVNDFFILSKSQEKPGVHLDGAPRARAWRPDGEGREQVPQNHGDCAQGAALTERGNGSLDLSPKVPSCSGHGSLGSPCPWGLPVPAPRASTQAEDSRAGGALSRRHPSAGLSVCRRRTIAT